MAKEIITEAAEYGPSLQELKLQLDGLAAAVDLNRRQSEQLLLFMVQQQSLLEKIVQDSNRSTMVLNMFDVWKNNVSAQLADINLNIDRTEEAIIEVQNNILNIPTEIQSIKQAIDQIKIFRSVDDY